MNLVELQNISKTFYKKDDLEHTVLSDISFSVKRGECFTIIGPNGSGKTTLLRIIALLEKQTRGKMFYDGKDIINLSNKEIVMYRRKFSFVRQKPVVLNTSVANNIAYGLKLRNVEKEEIIIHDFDKNCVELFRLIYDFHAYILKIVLSKIFKGFDNHFRVFE